MKTIRLLWIVPFIIIIMALGMGIIRSFFPKRTVLARVSTIIVSVNEPFTFVDSTENARSWLWLFGDGNKATTQRGTYAFKKAGKYAIKLIVDKKLSQMMEINVRNQPKEVIQNHVISIDGPLVGFQGEYLPFTAQGDDLHWRWNLGETPGVDSREATVLYKYNKPGKYTIRLMSESSKYPAVFVVHILPAYQVADSTNMMNALNNDIRIHLQRIAHGKDFNENYYYLVNKYLCKNEHVPVVIDGKKVNDFFSYCMGLRLDSGALIQFVDSEQRAASDTSRSCIIRINVKQSP